MLPLWIIDITENSSRRDCFISLVEKIKHVHISINRTSNTEETGSSSLDVQNESVETESRTIQSEESLTTVSDDSSSSLREELDKRDKKLAQKRTKADGDYWYYSQISFDSEMESLKIANNTNSQSSDDDATANISHEESETAVVDNLYRFQEDLVQEGMDFVASLRKSNCHPYQTINVVVLGDITQKRTQLLFPSIAAMLQKEKGRFLPHHIHQGMEIIGMLFIPCNVNTKDVDERARILKTLKEIEVQHTTKSVRGYDHMMLYQDVQNRTECSYPILNEEEQAQYLLQCLVHLYYACDTVHPLLSGTGSADDFYFSMGATSAFFDMAIEDENDIANIAYNLVNKFKEKGDKQKTADNSLIILEHNVIKAEQFIKAASDLEDLHIDSIDLRDPNPHPIKNYLSDSLKRIYYNSYLRFYPKNLMAKIVEHIDESTKEVLLKVGTARKRAYTNTALGIKPSIARLISKVTPNEGGLFFIEEQLKETQGCLSKEKSKVKGCLEVEFWSEIQDNHVPRLLKKHFEEYHASYTHDVETKNNGVGCAELKAEALKDLTSHISKEPTTLSIICRCVMAGIMCSLALVPILNILSPTFIDLGRIRRNSEFWYTLLFFLPTLVELIQYYLYLRKKGMLVRVLKSYYLHDAYARVANRIEMESAHFYDKLTELCGEYINRCKRIRKDLHIDTDKSTLEIEIPLTKFNININGGKFGEESIIPVDKIERSRIRIAGHPKFVNELDRQLYYILINYLNNDFSILFNDVDIIENQNMVLDEETGHYKFRSREEIEAENEDNWKNIIVGFKKTLTENIRKEMLPREHPTISDNLLQHFKHTRKAEFIEPMLNYTATNGEITSSADREYADIKTNQEVAQIFKPYLPHYDTKYQIDQFADLYNRYIFVTRWRSFEHFSLNRILPREDFDLDIRRQLVVESTTKEKEIPISSLLLWSLFPEDDASAEWFKLFSADIYNTAYTRRQVFREKLNTND